jgi:hypothetical protein
MIVDPSRPFARERFFDIVDDETWPENGVSAGP